MEARDAYVTAQSLIQQFCETHSLPQSFAITAENVYWPLADSLFKKICQQTSPFLLGIHGCQGSGKSTLSDFLLFVFEAHYSLPCQGLSIDDFYLTRKERERLAVEKHPLFKTRGVPGTHDLALLKSNLNQLVATPFLPTTIPRFNKALDDRFDESEWTSVQEKPKLIILEGWCVGALPQSDQLLVDPINELEKSEDPLAVWRTYANAQLDEYHTEVFSQLDALVMLKAPGFHAVKQWRLEQEERLVAKLNKEGRATDKAMNEREVERFIQHYERITTHALKTLPDEVNVVLSLDENRAIKNAEYK